MTATRNGNTITVAPLVDSLAEMCIRDRVYLVKPPYPSHVKYAVNAHYEYREQRGRKLLRLGDLHGLALVIHGYTLSYIFTCLLYTSIDHLTCECTSLCLRWCL